jgi:hypothetical protein
MWLKFSTHPIIPKYYFAGSSPAFSLQTQSANKAGSACKKDAALGCKKKQGICPAERVQGNSLQTGQLT